jgi:thiol:disulfide interchange protein DsbD
MKKLLFIILVISSITSFSQILKPVKWTSKIEKISDTELNVVFNATIDPDWHVYSQFTPEDGPLPLEIVFKNQKGNYELVGKTTESKYEKKFNDVFGVDEYFFSKKFTLTQKIKITNLANNVLKANISFQVCKKSCINDSENFSIKLPTKVVETTVLNGIKTVSETTVTEVLNDNKKQIIVEEKVIKTITNPKQSVMQPAQNESPKDLWAYFILSLIGGLLATITPCVFPMIPMTVSYFLKQSGNKTKGKFNALFYGFCIIAICVLFTLPFHLLEGISKDIFSDISTNVYLNFFFFVVFTTFAISFFGAFEITMPNSLSNKVDNASNSGGLLGIFFMALTLIIVSFSCIGPALGFVFGTTLSSDGGAFILTIAMFGFGLGLALPFMLFAIAPSFLGNLPKSGGWLNTVKVVFGFVELALAFKFLSNFDIGLDLQLLPREVFIACWIAIFGGLTMYLFGKITLPHDSPSSSISVGRLFMALITLSFSIYMIPGLWGAPLKIISAFTPPMSYSESPQGFGNTLPNSASQTLPEGAVYGANNIVSFEEYEVGLAYAKKVNKPILIDFTGKQCQNCRLMESNVWSNPEILEILKNDVVLISLYADDKKELPKNQQYLSKETNEMVTTIGVKWSEFQRQRYGTNARPYYVLIDINEKILNPAVAYTPNIETYKNWLITGISKFKK